MKKPDDSEKNFEERRKLKRLNKNFLLTYFELNNAGQKYEITQMKNISLGGMCFIATRPLEHMSKIGVELKTPYLADTTYVEGIVLESHEKVKNMIYEIRLKFEELNPQAEFLLNKLIEFFINGEKKSHA